MGLSAERDTTADLLEDPRHHVPPAAQLPADRDMTAGLPTGPPNRVLSVIRLAPCRAGIAADLLAASRHHVPVAIRLRAERDMTAELLEDLRHNVPLTGL
ncbi:hypothetical protein GCM10009764_34480 [Nocardia ninae]